MGKLARIGLLAGLLTLALTGVPFEAKAVGPLGCPYWGRCTLDCSTCTTNQDCPPVDGELQVCCSGRCSTLIAKDQSAMDLAGAAEFGVSIETWL
jgi:hypothetical protein